MMFTGTSQQQDTRFSDKEKKLMKQMKFGDCLNKRVDMSKVKLDVLRPWISKKITDILHIEDDVVVEFLYNQLEEEKFPCPKKMQINMTGFLNMRNARQFMGELWTLLLSAQENETGIPAEFIKKKKEDIIKRAEDQQTRVFTHSTDKDRNYKDSSRDKFQDKQRLLVEDTKSEEIVKTDCLKNNSIKIKHNDAHIKETSINISTEHRHKTDDANEGESKTEYLHKSKSTNDFHANSANSRNQSKISDPNSTRDFSTRKSHNNSYDYENERTNAVFSAISTGSSPVRDKHNNENRMKAFDSDETRERRNKTSEKSHTDAGKTLDDDANRMSHKSKSTISKRKSNADRLKRSPIGREEPRTKKRETNDYGKDYYRSSDRYDKNPRKRSRHSSERTYERSPLQTKRKRSPRQFDESKSPIRKSSDNNLMTERIGRRDRHCHRRSKEKSVEKSSKDEIAIHKSASHLHYEKDHAEYKRAGKYSGRSGSKLVPDQTNSGHSLRKDASRDGIEKRGSNQQLSNSHSKNVPSHPNSKASYELSTHSEGNTSRTKANVQDSQSHGNKGATAFSCHEAKGTKRTAHNKGDTKLTSKLSFYEGSLSRTPSPFLKLFECQKTQFANDATAMRQKDTAKRVEKHCSESSNSEADRSTELNRATKSAIAETLMRATKKDVLKLSETDAIGSAKNVVQTTTTTTSSTKLETFNAAADNSANANSSASKMSLLSLKLQQNAQHKQKQLLPAVQSVQTAHDVGISDDDEHNAASKKPKKLKKKAKSKSADNHERRHAKKYKKSKQKSQSKKSKKQKKQRKRSKKSNEFSSSDSSSSKETAVEHVNSDVPTSINESLEKLLRERALKSMYQVD